MGSLDSSHDLNVSSDVVWCAKCGAYAASRVQQLAGVCTERPDTVGKARELTMLRDGLFPAMASAEGQVVYLGPPALYDPTRLEGFPSFEEFQRLLGAEAPPAWAVDSLRHFNCRWAKDPYGAVIHAPACCLKVHVYRARILDQTYRAPPALGAQRNDSFVNQF